MTTWLGSQDQGWKVGYVSSKLGDLIYADGTKAWMDSLMGVNCFQGFMAELEVCYKNNSTGNNKIQ